MKIRIDEIAQRAGTSKTTVSRALNAETRPLVSSSTLKRIDKIIFECGYTPNLAAKYLRKPSTKTIGIVFPAFKGVFHHTHYSNLLAGITDYMMDSDYQMKMLLLKPDPQRWSNYNFKAVERVDGLIVTHWPEFFTKEAVHKLNLPCVFINDVVPEFPVYFVCGDHFMGGQLAARHLYDLGHRHVAVLKGIDWCLDNHLRADGFIRYFEDHDVAVPPSSVLCAHYREDEAYTKMDELLKNDPAITGVFCCNDDMALGVMRRLKERNIACPGQISVIGFDDILRGSFSIPSLTTVRFSEYQAAWEGSKLLLNYLNQGDFTHPLQGHQLYPIELVERNSTGPSPTR